MQIDWFTVAAQIVNFFILVLLLRKFLYGPVVNAMNQREEKFKNREQQARQKKIDAEKKQHEYENRHRELEEGREFALSSARKEIEDSVWEITERAGKQYMEKEKEWKKSFEREKKSHINELKEQIGKSVCVTARKTLKDLSGSLLEDMVLNIFVEKLENSIKSGESEEMQQILNGKSDVVEVYSAFKMDKKMKNTIKRVLDLRKDNAPEYSFAQSSELICGIEIRLKDYSISWNVNDYIKSIEKRIINEESVNA